MNYASSFAHVTVRSSRRLRGLLKLPSVRVDGTAPAAVIDAIKRAAWGRPSRDERSWIRRIELMRSLLLTSASPLEIEDFGAGGGPRFDNGGAALPQVARKTLGQMTLSSKPPRWAYLLFRLVRELKPGNALEMGSCVGISASYQAAALELNGRGRLITLEGAGQLAACSAHTLADLDLDHRTEVRQGRFSDTLRSAIADLEPIEFAFVDGNHLEDATIEYMQAVTSAAADESVLVFDDINWSDGMRRAWSRIVGDDRFALTLDLRSVGIAVVSKSATTRTTASIPYY